VVGIACMRCGRTLGNSVEVSMIAPMMSSESPVAVSGRDWMSESMG